MHAGMLRAVGAATALYGLAVTVRPELLARPSGLVDGAGRVAPDTRTSLRPLGWRDMVGGLAMACAPEGAALSTATCLRAAADAGDALLLGRTLAPDVRRKAVAVSLTWGALSALGAALPGRGAQGARAGCGSERARS